MGCPGIWTHVLCVMFLVDGVSANFDVRLPPQILQGPVAGPPVIFKQGESLSPTCRARGYPQPCVTWERLIYRSSPSVVKKDDSCEYQFSQHATEDTLLVDNASAADEGTFRCKATNLYGTAVSNWTTFKMAELFVPMPGPVATEINSQEGENVLLTCPFGVRGSPKPTFKWIRSQPNGAKVSEVELSDRIVLDLLGRLHLLQVTRNDVAEDEVFTCIVQNKFLGREERGTSYKVNIAPGSEHLPDLPPKSVMLDFQNVTEGDTLRLQCIYAGRPIPTISWKKDGHDLTQRRHHLEQRGTILVIPNATGEDSGAYECVGYNRMEQTSHELNILVYERPQFVESPASVNITEGGSATFRCRSRAVPQPNIKWFINGKFMRVKSSGNTQISADDTTLTVTDVQRDDVHGGSGDLFTVQCSTNNVIFRDGIVANAYLNVLRKTAVMKLDIQQEETAQSMLRFQCHHVTDDSTPASVEWRHDDRVITDNNEHMTISQDYRSLFINLYENSSLTGGNPELVCPQGVISCRASNGHSTGEEAVAMDHFQLQDKIDVGVIRTATMHIQSGPNHGEVFIPCGVRKCGPTHVEWVKDGEDLTKDGRPLTTLPPGVLIEDDNIHIPAGSNDTLNELIGLYTCVVTYWRGRVVARSSTHLLPGSGNYAAAPSVEGGEDEWLEFVKTREFLYILGGAGFLILVITITCTAYKCYHHRGGEKGRGRLDSDVIALQSGMQTPVDINDRYSNRYTIPLVDNNIYDTIHDQDVHCSTGTAAGCGTKWTGTGSDSPMPPNCYEEPPKGGKVHPSPPSVPPPNCGTVQGDGKCGDGCEQYEKMGRPQHFDLPPFPDTRVGMPDDCGLVQNSGSLLHCPDTDPAMAMAGYMPMRGRPESVCDTRQI